MHYSLTSFKSIEHVCIGAIITFAVSRYRRLSFLQKILMAIHIILYFHGTRQVLFEMSMAHDQICFKRASCEQLTTN